VSRAAICALLILLVPRSGSAHPINTALSVISADAIRIGHGLVTRDPQGRWRFVCPVTWGGPIAPLSLALDGDTMVVIGEEGAFEMTREGIVMPRFVPGVAARTAREVERAGDRVLALASGAKGSVIASFGPGSSRALVEDERRLHSIEASPSGFAVTSSDAEGIRIEEYGLDGAPAGASLVRYAGIATATVGIERAGDELFAVIAQPAEYVLARIEGDRLRLIASSAAPILGPVKAGEEVWFIEEGALLRVNGGEVQVVDQTQLYGCLEEDAGTIRACIDAQIFELLPDGRRELLFELAEVKGPRLSHLSPEDRVTCEFEWTIFAGEVGLDPTIPPDEEPPPPHPECGCSTTEVSRSLRSWWCLLLLACLRAWRQRSRRLVRLGPRCESPSP
jgi:hypothetical protein